MKHVTAIYPGSFDPLTNGHLDLIDRGAASSSELVVAILRNPEKNPLFTVEERREMLEEATASDSNVRIDTFEGLLVEYAERANAPYFAAGDPGRKRLRVRTADGAHEPQAQPPE